MYLGVQCWISYPVLKDPCGKKGKPVDKSWWGIGAPSFHDGSISTASQIQRPLFCNPLATPGVEGHTCHESWIVTSSRFVMVWYHHLWKSNWWPWKKIRSKESDARVLGHLLVLEMVTPKVQRLPRGQLIVCLHVPNPPRTVEGAAGGQHLQTQTSKKRCTYFQSLDLDLASKIRLLLCAATSLYIPMPLFLVPAI